MMQTLVKACFLLPKQPRVAALTHLVPFLHKSLYGAEEGAVTSHRDQDFSQRIDLPSINLPIHLRKGLHQIRVTLTNQELSSYRKNTMGYSLALGRIVGNQQIRNVIIFNHKRNSCSLSMSIS